MENQNIKSAFPSLNSHEGSRLIKKLTFASFLFVSFIATGVVEMLNDLFALKVPAFSYVSPALSAFWVPVIILIIWFNAISNGFGKLQLLIPNSLIAACTMLFLMFVLESYHALVCGSIPDFELGYCWVWILFLFMALSNFTDYRTTNWSEVIIIIIAVCSSIICLFSLLFPHNSLREMGIVNFFSLQLRPRWDGVNSHSYFAALIYVISLYKMLYCKLDKYRLLFWVSILAVNLIGVIFNKARGAWFDVLLMTAMMLMVRICTIKSKKVVITGVLIGIPFIAFLLLLIVHTNIESFLSFGRGLASARTRFMMFSTAIHIFLKSPLTGIGWAKVLEYRVSGHSIHGVIQTITASYGIIGVIPLLGTIYFSLPKKFNIQNAMLILPVLFITGTASVALMTPPLWFAIALFFLFTASDMEAYNEGVFYVTKQ